MFDAWLAWRSEIARRQLAGEDVSAIGGMASPLSQIRNLERVYRVLETMGATTRRTGLREIPALAGADPERYFVEFLRSPRFIDYPGRVVAPQSFPEELAMSIARPGGKSPVIMQDVPSQVVNALRMVFGQRTPEEYVRRGGRMLRR